MPVRQKTYICKVILYREFMIGNPRQIGYLGGRVSLRLHVPI